MSSLSEVRARAVQPRWMCDSCGHENNEVCPACRTRQQGIAAGTILPPLNDAGYLLARLDEAVALLKGLDECRACNSATDQVHTCEYLLVTKFLAEVESG